MVEEKIITNNSTQFIQEKLQQEVAESDVQISNRLAKRLKEISNQLLACKLEYNEKEKEEKQKELSSMLKCVNNQSKNSILFKRKVLKGLKEEGALKQQQCLELEDKLKDLRKNSILDDDFAIITRDIIRVLDLELTKIEHKLNETETFDGQIKYYLKKIRELDNKLAALENEDLILSINGKICLINQGDETTAVNLNKKMGCLIAKYQQDIKRIISLTKKITSGMKNKEASNQEPIEVEKGVFLETISFHSNRK